jgi:hypothetical protein
MTIKFKIFLPTPDPSKISDFCPPRTHQKFKKYKDNNSNNFLPFQIFAEIRNQQDECGIGDNYKKLPSGSHPVCEQDAKYLAVF